MTLHGQNIAALHQGARPDVVNAIRQASSQTGVDFSYLLEKAATESSFDPTAQARTSSARGLYQFVDRTWLDTMDRHGAKHGYANVAKAIERDAHGNPRVADPKAREYILSLRDDPRVSALMAAEFARDNEQSLEQSLGREVGKAELYMAHFLGAGGAAKFLSEMDTNASADACAIVPAAARANAAVFYDGNKALSLEEVFARFEDKFGEAQPARESAEPAPMLAMESTAEAMTEARLDIRLDAAHAALRAAIFAAPESALAALDARQGASVSMLDVLKTAPDPALAAPQGLQAGPERSSGHHSWGGRPDLAAQLFTLSLLQAFDTESDDRQSNSWLA
ncbi:MAG: transglycosylase SLT domain-containing protein [Pseudomonadota bacterium]|nr:transglycosylase SLT domain-containing protein [Pseudomonadota bacterium]